MRQALVNANPDLAAANSKYVMRITGDNEEGKVQLDNFIDPESTFPVIATTSRLMTTGVDAQTCHLIVLDRRINSMTEFKQIIGRGTRINEDYNKFFFTIMDFRRATALFADPDFDGDPVQIYEPSSEQSPVPPDDPREESKKIPSRVATMVARFMSCRRRTVLGVATSITLTMSKSPLSPSAFNTWTPTASSSPNRSRTTHGRPCENTIRSLDAFLTAWNEADRKQAIVEELAGQGVFLDELAEQVGRDYDAFDLVCHVAFDQPPLTRRERADHVKKAQCLRQVWRESPRRA